MRQNNFRRRLEAGLRNSLRSDSEKLQKEDPVIGLCVRGSKVSQTKLRMSIKSCSSMSSNHVHWYLHPTTSYSILNATNENHLTTNSLNSTEGYSNILDSQCALIALNLASAVATGHARKAASTCSSLARITSMCFLWKN